jgi:hypothetical protein
MRTPTKETQGFNYEKLLVSIPTLGMGPRHIREWFQDQVTEIVQQTFIDLLELENTTVCRIQNEWEEYPHDC